jgi:LacI family transcriptional regulator
MLNRMMTGKTLMVPHQLVAPTGVIPRNSTDFVAVDDPLVAAALRYISANISRVIDVPDVCRQVVTGRRTLERRFRSVLGRSIGDEIRRLRLERAKRDLAQREVSLKQVARNAGFRDAKRLHEAFRSALGESPSSYRNRIIVRV